jgi:hypothetical protein
MRHLLVEENFSCCQTCGVQEILERVEEEISDGEEIVGYVFYDMQDNESKMAGQPFYLTYGPVDNPQQGKAALSSETIGRIVCECLALCGMPYEWDGDPDKRILVLPPSFRPS